MYSKTVSELQYRRGVVRIDLCMVKHEIEKDTELRQRRSTDTPYPTTQLLHHCVIHTWFRSILDDCVARFAFGVSEGNWAGFVRAILLRFGLVLTTVDPGSVLVSS